MGKILFSLILLSSLSFGLMALAQDSDLPAVSQVELPNPGLTPDSPFYFLDTLGEKIGMLFTFGAEKKAEKAMKYAEEKIAEAKAMAEKSKPEAVEKANQKYQEFLGLANTEVKEAKEQGKDVEELATLITEATLRHQEILVEVFKKVPEEAKIAIEKAIEASRKGSEEAVQAVTGAKKETLLQKIKLEQLLAETANWQIYTNEKYGYSFKYPPDCFYGPMPVYCKGEPPEERSPECLCFLNGEDPDSVFLQAFTGEKDNLIPATLSVTHRDTSLHNPPSGTDLIEWLKEKFSPRSDEDIPDNPNFKIDGIPAVRVYLPGSFNAPSGERIYLIKNDKLFIISMIDVDSESNKELYDRILATFKFVELEEIIAIPDTPGMLDIDIFSTAGSPYKIGWTAVREAITYDLERDTDSSFSNPGTVYFGPLNSFSETLSPSVSTTYYFRVKACNNYGCSSWSKITELWVEVPKVEEKPYIKVISPNGGEAWIVGNTYDITWTSRGVENVAIFLLGCKTKACTIETGIDIYNIPHHLLGAAGSYPWIISPKDIGLDISKYACFKIKIKEATQWPAGILEKFLAMLGIFSTQTSDLVEDVSDGCLTIIEKEEEIPVEKPPVEEPLPEEVSPPSPEEKITVTSPNGGEIWQLYNTHNITWTPDPESRYVHAYLEKMQQGTFITVGKVIPGGKGSIQWDGEIDRSGNYASPGDYYIKLVNAQNNATDRSDGSLKLVAANDFVKADLKIKSAEGIYSDGPVTAKTRTIQISWSSAVADTCSYNAVSKDTSYYTPVTKLPATAGTKEITLPGDGTAYYVRLTCNSSLYDGNTGDDQVSVNILCPLPGTPILTDPGISVNKHEPFTLNWTSISGAEWYALQRGTSTDFPIGPWICEVNSDTDNPGVGTSLPEVTTTYYYRVKVCNYCGCGSYSNVVDMKVIVPSITVTSPNGGENWVIGKTYDIKWITSGYDSSSPIQIGLRDTRYDPNTGKGEATIVNTTNSGSYTWTIPSQFEYMTLGAGNVYKIVVYMEGIGGDTSNLGFSIVHPSITLTSPSGGEKWKLGETYQITWDSVGIKDIQIQVAGPIPDLMTVSLLSNPGYYNWTIGSDFPIDSNYKVYISGTGYNNKTYADFFDPGIYFSIIPSITVTSPDGGEQWIKGNIYNITWISSEGVDNVRIDVDFHGNGSIHSYTLVSNVPAVPGSWSWTIGAIHSDLPTGDQVKIAVIPYPVGYDSWDSYDQSDSYFSITEP